MSTRRPSFLFFFNDTATTEIYTLSLHDALPICRLSASPRSSRSVLVDRQVALHLGHALLHDGDVLRELRQEDGALERGDEKVRDRLRAAVATDVAAAMCVVEGLGQPLAPGAEDDGQ